MNGLNAENKSPILGMGLMPNFSSQNWAKVQIFFKALWAGLTNPRDILDSFTVTPLEKHIKNGEKLIVKHLQTFF